MISRDHPHCGSVLEMHLQALVQIHLTQNTWKAPSLACFWTCRRTLACDSGRLGRQSPFVLPRGHHRWRNPCHPSLPRPAGCICIRTDLEGTHALHVFAKTETIPCRPGNNWTGSSPQNRNTDASSRTPEIRNRGLQTEAVFIAPVGSLRNLLRLNGFFHARNAPHLTCVRRRRLRSILSE